MRIDTATAVAPSAASTHGRSDPTSATLGSLGLIVLLIGALLPLTDFFIVNVALPTIDSDLKASPGMLQLVVAGYAIAYALLLVVGGRLGDAFGRRRLFLIGMAGFTLTSLACGVAPGAGSLVLARVLQGAASAMMLPQVLSTIQATRTGHGRTRALGLYGATGGLGTVAGQLLGGLLVSANIGGYGWRPIFLVNVPVGIVGLVLATRLVPDTRSEEPAGIDVPGTVLLALTLLTLLVPLTEGRSLGWPIWTVAALVVCPFAAVGFVVAERRVEAAGGVPFVPPSVLALSSMRRGLGVGVPFFSGFGGFMFVYALVIQDGAHLGPLSTGLSLVPMAVGMLGASLSMAHLVARFGRRLIIAGALIQLTGFVALAGGLTAAWPHPSVLDLLPGTLLCGIGQGWVMTPLFRIVLSEVPARLSGVGSGVLTTMQQTSLALGVATLGSIYLTFSTSGHLGPLHAALVVLGVLSIISVTVAVSGRQLPD